jgi:hypothetical protein
MGKLTFGDGLKKAQSLNKSASFEKRLYDMAVAIIEGNIGEASQKERIDKLYLGIAKSGLGAKHLKATAALTLLVSKFNIEVEDAAKVMSASAHNTLVKLALSSGMDAKWLKAHQTTIDTYFKHKAEGLVKCAKMHYVRMIANGAIEPEKASVPRGTHKMEVLDGGAIAEAMVEAGV